MIEKVEIGNTYYSKSGIEFVVTALAKHAQDCSISMVVYANLEDTFDSKALTLWVMEELLFLRRFTEN